MDLLNRISNFIGRRSDTTIVVLALLIVAGLTAGNCFIGQNFSSALFFVIPIAAATWYVGRTWGLIIAALSGTGLLVTDIVFRSGEHGLLAAWNAFFPFVFFMLFALLLSMLKDSLAREAMLARTDPLTGLLNRRAFAELASVEMSRSRRYSHAVSLAYADADDFKKVNDTLGHEEGDRVLVMISDALKSNTRRSDIVARMGGDEFAVLLPETDSPSANAAMSKVRVDVNASAEKRGWPVTLSVGIVTFTKAPDTLDDMIKAADALMYSIKETSKNNIASKTIEGDARDPSARRRDEPSSDRPAM